MDRQKGEGYSEQSGPDHNHSYSQSDDSSSHYQQQHNHIRSFGIHPWDATNDHQLSEEDDRFHHHRPFNLSNGEQSNSPGVWEDNNSGYSVPVSGRKRDFHHSAQASPRDCAESGSIVKLYVGGVPRTVTEGDIRSVFRQHGNVIEVVILKDKRTAQQQECCFVKYSAIEEADQAIWALHGQYTFHGGRFPIKVKYADGERDRLAKCFSRPSSASVERVLAVKLYVGCVNKQASKFEIEEIFSPFGIVEDVYIVRDEMKQPKGCAFVQFSHREMAIAAINATHGSYVMRGCEQPLIVRFAVPKKLKVGDSRTSPCVDDRVAGRILPSFPHKAVSTMPEPEPVDGINCEWSEHICPDGYPYYYNCTTCESRWEKPEEYILHEQQLLKLEQLQQRVAHP